MKTFILLLFVSFLLPLPLSAAEAPSQADEMASSANQYFQQGAYAEAEEEYNKVVERYPGYALAYNNLGIIASTDITRIKESILYFLKAIRSDPSYADPYSNMGVICFRINEVGNAIQYLQRAVKLDAGNFRHYFTLGWIYFQGKKDIAKAEECFQKAIELNAEYAESVYALGALYSDSGNVPLVLEMITKLRVLKREDLARALESEIRRPQALTPDTPIPSLIPAKSVKADYEISEPDRKQGSYGKAQVKGSATISIRITGVAKPVTEAVDLKGDK